MGSKILTHPYAAFFCRVALGAVFIYASVDKILNPEAFAQAVQNYRILPLESVNLFAIILPWLELVSGLLLVLGLFSGGSILLITFLTVVFLIALSSVAIRGIDTDCGCFSSSGTGKVTFLYLLRDLGILAVAFHIFLYNRGIWSIDTLMKRKVLS